jgi:CRISPR-associated protein Csb1
MSNSLSLSRLQEAVARDAAIRCRTKLSPAGGPSDKVFPATYEGGEYASECRRVDGRDVPCVVLDSVQSQANRMEERLRELYERGLIELPVISVDFASAGLADVPKVTSLDAPHRVFDAILRDSCLDGTQFMDSAVGKKIEGFASANATALFEHCPTALLFGAWNSTGKRGGSGAKVARSIVSEVVAFGVAAGARSGSRLDPLAISAEVTIYAAENALGWTPDERQAVQEGKKPKLFAAGKGDKPGRPSLVNHGNVTPSIEEGKGGVTFDFAEQTTVLTFGGLRKLRFPLAGKTSPAVDDAARTVLAALGLVAATSLRRGGCDLRSRCTLVPSDVSGWELLDGAGSVPSAVQLDADAALDLFSQAVVAAKAAGLPWASKEVVLSPSSELVALVRESRKREAAKGRFATEEVNG